MNRSILSISTFTKCYVSGRCKFARANTPDGSMVSRPVSFKVFIFIFIAPLYEKFLKALICCTFMRCADFKKGLNTCV